MSSRAATKLRPSAAPEKQLDLELDDLSIEVKLAKANARQIAESFPERTRLGLSRAFCHHTMEIWWGHLRGRSRRQIRQPWCEIPEITDELAVTAAHEVGDLRHRSTEPPILVFVEVVATDGPVNEPRRDELLKLAVAGGFAEEQVAFVTAFEDRQRTPSRLVSALAWNTFAWYASEPDGIVAFRRSATTQITLPQLLTAIEEG